MRISFWPALSVLVVPALASADRIKPSGSAALYDLVATDRSTTGLRFARQVLPAREAAPSTGLVAESRVIYLNRTGVTLYPGVNDARTNRSTIASQATAIPAWNVNATVWAETVSCIQEIFAPFDVSVVTADPGNVPHIEAVFGGSPQALGMAGNVAGVSPFTLDCSIIENSIVFTFTDVIPQNARLACEIQAQEIAHSFGLDHELLASDPMTYLEYNGERSFKDQTVSCGEYSQRACGINGSVCRPNQNSVRLLRERLGTAAVPDGIAPVVGINAPTNGATVRPGFVVDATATDDVLVTAATLYIDDVQVATLAAPPFLFATAATLVDGSHVIRVEATDGANIESSEVTVNVRTGGGGNGNGDGGGTGDGGTDDDGADPDDVTGGCSTGGTGSLGMLIALVGLAATRRSTARRRGPG